MTAPPHGMTVAAWTRLQRLGDDARYRVLERAAIIAETGCGWAEADARAWQQEAVAQRPLFGGT